MKSEAILKSTHKGAHYNNYTYTYKIHCGCLVFLDSLFINFYHKRWYLLKFPIPVSQKPCDPRVFWSLWFVKGEQMRSWQSRGKHYVLGWLQKGLASIAFAESSGVTENPVSIFMIWKSHSPLKQAVMGHSEVPGRIVLSYFSFPSNLSVEGSVGPICFLSLVA